MPSFILFFFFVSVFRWEKSGQATHSNESQLPFWENMLSRRRPQRSSRWVRLARRTNRGEGTNNLNNRKTKENQFKGKVHVCVCLVQEEIDVW